jgi:hypothetical protein
LPEHLDPFLAFDHFEMAEPFFPPHPHAGFSAVTYMFPESKNGFRNRDSRGDQIEIHPGDMHWTCAGSGVLHEEVPITTGVVCHGLQIFVNLHSSKKWMSPEVLHLDASSVPKVLTEGAVVRVVVGTHGDQTSPLVPPTKVTLLDVTLEPGGEIEHVPAKGESRFVYVIDGVVEVGPKHSATRLEKGDAGGLSIEGDHVLVRAVGGPAHIVVGGGTALRERAVFYGPFCMSSEADIRRAILDYESGKMGRLEPSFRPAR